MKPASAPFVWPLAFAVLLVGCASPSSGDGSPGGASASGDKPQASGGLGKARQDIAQASVPAKAQDKPAKGSGDATRQRDDRCLPDKSVARDAAKPAARAKSGAGADSPKKTTAMATKPEAEFAKALAEETAYDQGLRQRFGISTDLDLRGLLSPEEVQEAARLHAATEAARRRLALTDKSPRPASDAAKPLSVKAPGDTATRDTADKATAGLPSIPEAGAISGAKTPTALHLSGWFTDEKAHQAWRDKQLAKLAEAKESPPPESAAK